MGRFLVYLSITALALFVLAAVFLFQTGGGSSSAATSVSVHDLSVAPEAHAAERVVTTGVLRFLHEPDDHFAVTADGLAVIVRFYEAALRPLDGRTVTVTGRFGYDKESGTYIEAESVTPTE
jgi:hypothetical protein